MPQKLDLISRGAAIGVLEGDDFALLGDAELAADRPAGEAAIARPAGAPRGSRTAPAVKKAMVTRARGRGA